MKFILPILLTFFLPPIELMTICPPALEIAPARCEENMFTNFVWIFFEGPKITQSVIDSTFQVLRQYENPWIFLDSVHFKGLSMQEINFSFLSQTNIGGIHMMDNYNLTTLSGGRSTLAGLMLIELTNFVLHNSPFLTREGLGNIFQLFSPGNLLRMHLVNTSIVPSPNGEFLPGIGRFNNLEMFSLTRTHAKGIGGSQFYTNKGMWRLVLERNQIEEIKERAFYFEELINEHNQFVVDLRSNNLTNEKIHSDHGLDKINMNVFLILSNNPIGTLSAQTFEPMLRARPNNTLYLDNTGLICDGRVKWLKYGRAEFERRVYDADCVNDPGFTVFTSDLVN